MAPTFEELKIVYGRAYQVFNRRGAKLLRECLGQREMTEEPFQLAAMSVGLRRADSRAVYEQGLTGWVTGQKGKRRGFQFERPTGWQHTKLNGICEDQQIWGSESGSQVRYWTRGISCNGRVLRSLSRSTELGVIGQWDLGPQPLIPKAKIAATCNSLGQAQVSSLPDGFALCPGGICWTCMKRQEYTAKNKDSSFHGLS